MKRREFMGILGALPFVGKAFTKPAAAEPVPEYAPYVDEQGRTFEPVIDPEVNFTLNNKIGSEGHHELKVDGIIDPSGMSAVHAWLLTETVVEVRLDGMVFKGHLTKMQTVLSDLGSLWITVIGSSVNNKYWNTGRFKKASISSPGFCKIKFTRINFASVIIDEGVIQYIPEFGDGVMFLRKE